MKFRVRSESVDERRQGWSDPLRRRARLRWIDEHFGGSRSEQELCELESRRELEERAAFGPREHRAGFESDRSVSSRDRDWRDEPRDRFGRDRSEVRFEQPVSRRRHHGFSGVADDGSNLGFSGGTASIGFGEDIGEAPGISEAPGIAGAHLGAPAPSSPRRRGPHAGKGPKDFRRSDERLREEVSWRLRADPDIDASEILLAVQDGEVTLEGSVPDRQTKRDAAECAENVMGVCQVNNRLRISG